MPFQSVLSDASHGQPVRRMTHRETGGDIDRATPDGFHYSVDMHRAIGTKLAGVIAEWADGQPHFKRGTEGGESDA